MDYFILFFKYLIKEILYCGLPILPWQLKVRMLKNIHKGKSCILVGNGPSVTYSDLGKINNTKAVKFVFNRFHKVYDKCEFSPDYTVSIDPIFVNDFFDELILMHRGKLLVGLDRVPFLANKCSFFRIKNTEPFEFSCNPLKYTSTGASVIVATIQLAYYMGIKDVFIYGVDHHFHFDNNDSELSYEKLTKGEGNHFIKNYRSGKSWCPPNMLSIEQGFKECAIFLVKNGGQLVNISRESKLPYVEKVNFDDVIEGL